MVADHSLQIVVHRSVGQIVADRSVGQIIGQIKLDRGTVHYIFTMADRGDSVGEVFSIESLLAKLRRDLPQRARSSICLSPLPRWLADWPHTPLEQFCVRLDDASSAAQETARDNPSNQLATTPWVVAYLPQMFVPRTCQPPARGTDNQPTGTDNQVSGVGVSGAGTDILPSSGPWVNSLLLASSRVVAWSERHDLAVAVRHLLAQQSSDTCCLVTGRGMTCQALSIHASHYFGLSCWEWVPAEKLTWQSWFESITRACRERPSGLRHGRLFVTPSPVQTSDKSPSFPPDTLPNNTPVADWLAFRTARQVNVLTLRRDGHTATLVRQAIESDLPPGRVQVYLPPIQTNEPKSIVQYRAIAQQLMDSGAVGWHVTVPVVESIESANVKKSPYQSNKSRPLAERLKPVESHGPSSDGDQVSFFEPGSATDYLSHHTRGNPQQWPEEVEGDFWWRWLTEPHRSSWPWETLLRIACQQKLRAGRRLIPGQQPVVCFSARCPTETAAQRTFRPHLRRWDYEPYGIAIQRVWLEQHGARPVEYIEDAQPLHHFQQVRYSNGDEGARVDWSLEQEIRIEGDLDLRTVGPAAMFYFVRTRSEAQRLADYTACSVKYLEREKVEREKGTSNESDILPRN